MGKKKSVVLMVLLTIVIVVLTALTVFPAFPIPGTVQKWNPVVLQYDLGADLGGGYYAYYYPEGVVSETEYNDNLAVLVGEEKTEYEESYVRVDGSTLYFSVDEKLGVTDGEALTQEFKDEFNAAAKEIAARFEAKGYSDYRVAVVEGYALRVELPASEPSDKASAAFSLLANTGELTLTKGGEKIDPADYVDGEAEISDLIANVSIGSRYSTSYLKIEWTRAGKAMIDEVKGSLSASTEANGGDSSSLTTLDVQVGDELLAQICSDNIMDNGEVRVNPVDGYNADYLKTFEILIDSALQTGGFDVTFTADSVRRFEPVYGANVLTLLYIALAIVLVAVLVLPAVKMGRFGVVSAYSSLSYLIVVAMCFAFITSGTLEITLGSVLIFLVGLVLLNVVQYSIYNAIKAEFNLGKTVESSVKGGYKKKLWGVIDLYAVLLLGSLAMLIGTAGVHTLALQALIVVVTCAFINLLWARAINFTYLSASKNKYKYFRFVREDDDDE
ncbi:MAG: hypothetical protein J6B56_02905 [Clostridia bacterium]|nr:hypothetical protein [Clostridia bacterium]